MASAPTVVPCPVCGEPAERQMSAGAGLVFHGTGFYITDYGKDGKKDQKSAGRRTSESSKEAAPAAPSGEGTASGGSSASGSDSASSGSSAADAKSGGEAPPKASETPARPVTPTKASE